MKLCQQMQGNHHKIGSADDYQTGPIKIKDGLFMGDKISAKDLQFIMSNKVTRVINTVCEKIPNYWEKFGVQYLSVHWTKKEQQIFTANNNTLETICSFIDQAMEKGQSCLVHSINGKTRASTVIASYLMNQYKWSLQKTLQFIGSKKENLLIRMNFVRQLQRVEWKLNRKIRLSTNWTVSKSEEELLLTNTLINSQPIIVSEPYSKEFKPFKKVAFDDKIIIHEVSQEVSNSKQRERAKKFVDSRNNQKVGKEQAENNTKEDEERVQFKEFVEECNMGSNLKNIKMDMIQMAINNYLKQQKKQNQQIIYKKSQSSLKKTTSKVKNDVIKNILINDPEKHLASQTSPTKPNTSSIYSLTVRQGRQMEKDIPQGKLKSREIQGDRSVSLLSRSTPLYKAITQRNRTPNLMNQKNRSETRCSSKGKTTTIYRNNKNQEQKMGKIW